MGLLGSILKKTASEAVNSAAKKTGSAIGSAIASGISGAVENKVKTDTQQAVNELAQAGAAVNEAAAELNGAMGYAQPKQVKLVKQHREAVTPVAGAAESDFPRGSVEYFHDLVVKNLPGVECAAAVELERLGLQKPEKSVPVSLVLLRAGKPVLALFLVSKSKYKTHAVLNSMNACELAGIPAIRFFTEFSNEAGYVIGRIKAVML